MNTYVYAQSSPLVPWDWWMLIKRPADNAAAARRRFESVLKICTNPHNVMSKYVARQLAATSLDIHFPVDRIGWYMNRVGGTCYRMHAISQTIQSSVFPGCADEHIGFSISRWPNGTHWYARLADGTDVELDGKNKWMTKERAESAAKLFVKKQGMS